MIKPFIKGKVTSCKKNERPYLTPGYPKVSYGVAMEITHIGSCKLPEPSVFFFDIPDEVPVGASIEFIYEIGEDNDRKSS